MGTTVDNLSRRLPSLFDQLRKLLPQEEPNIPVDSLISWLPGFMSRLRPVLLEEIIPPVLSPSSQLEDHGEFEKWLTSMKQPLALAKREGAFCDPWQITGLGHDEVRNSAVLAWFLNPVGTHGYDITFLQALMSLNPIRDCFRECTPEQIERARVATECCPDGDIGNRVDIEIDADNFYLVIEVKINATEGVDQLNRYCRVAKAKAGHRPWLVMFLTKNGYAPVTASEYSDKVVAISWKKLSEVMLTAMKIYGNNSVHLFGVKSPVTTLLASSFFGHIKRFS